MTYPPGSPGYPPAQQPTTQFSAPTQQFGKLPDADPLPPKARASCRCICPPPSRRLASRCTCRTTARLFEASGTDFFTPTLLDLGVVASLLAALIAGVGLVPKQKTAPALVAVLSVLGFLLAVSIVLTAPSGVNIKWGLYLIIAFSVIQAIVAVAVLLFDAGVITPPAPRPRYEQQQYGQYGAPGPITDSLISPAHRTSRARSSSSALAIRRSTAVATRVARRRADSRLVSRAALRRRPADSPPTASRSRATRRRHRCRHNRRLPRSPALRRRNLGRACVNFARLSVRGERPN